MARTEATAQPQIRILKPSKTRASSGETRFQKMVLSGQLKKRPRKRHGSPAFFQSAPVRAPLSGPVL